MSQHDFEIANQGFPSFRSDLNSGLQALASNSADATEPSTTYAYQFWYDETTDLLKMRNGDDDAWITLAYFDQTNDEWEVRSAVIQAVDSAGVVIKTDDGTTRIEIQDDGDVSINSGQLFVDQSAGNVGIGTSSPDLTGFGSGTNGLEIADATIAGIRLNGNVADSLYFISGASNHWIYGKGAVPLTFSTAGTEAMRIDASGNLLVGKTADSLASAGFQVLPGANGYSGFTNTRTDGNGFVGYFNRNGSDGGVVEFRHANVGEGNISISGTTVSYNGGHLARWSQLIDSSKDESIVKGTVLSNLDEMCEWKRVEFEYQALVSEAVEAQDEVLDEEGNVVQEAVEAQDAVYETRTTSESYDGDANVGDVIDWEYEGETVQATVIVEDNEQLNRTKVSDVEGDPNVAGVFVNWDQDDDMNIAMTGDMVIRIAEDVTVQRGDLLMSAGDGTAKPQGDDIVRSKTIAKVTSTHVSHTYDDGSYLVPCVLMAC